MSWKVVRGGQEEEERRGAERGSRGGGCELKAEAEVTLSAWSMQKLLWMESCSERVGKNIV